MMADVFIAYSRRDIEFVRRMQEALQEQNRKPWIDWKDIEPTAEWQAEIDSAIEGSDAFVFIISPDSVVSRECQRELARAAGHLKHLVPVVRRDVVPTAVPAVLAALQYVFFREGDNFDSAFRRLLGAIDTDLDWVRAHTRLLVRAREWEKSEHDASSLLRGRELQDAEGWLADVGASNERHATPLQIQYILASQRSQHEEMERSRALLNKALGRHLATLSQMLKNEQADLISRSALLAVEAMRRFPSLEADQAVRGALSLLSRPLIRLDHEAAVTDAVLSPDGRLLATACEDTFARVWCISNGREIVRIGHQLGVSGIVFSGDGTVLATREREGKTASVWRTRDGYPLAHLVHEDVVRAIALSPDGRAAATSCSDDTLHLWDVASGNKVWHGNQAAVFAIAFSPRGEYVASAGMEGTARVWMVATGDEISRMDHGNDVNAVAFSPDGKCVASASGNVLHPRKDNSVRVWEVSSGRELLRVRHENQINGIAFSPDGGRIASTSDDTTVRIWETENGRELARLKHDADVNYAEFSPDGDRIVTGGVFFNHRSAARLWEISTGRELARMQHLSGVNAIAFSPNGDFVMTSGGNCVTLWEPRGAPEVLRLEHRDSINDLSFNREGSRLVSAGADWTACVWNTTTGQQLLRIKQDRNIGAAVLSPDEKHLATACMNGTAKIWTVADGSEVACMKDESGTISDVLYTPDGRHVVTSNHQTVRMWVVATGQESIRIAHGEPVTCMALSPDGRYLATGSRDQRVRVWGVVEQHEFITIAHDAPVSDLTFSRDSRQLATADEEGAVRLWTCGTDRHEERLKGKSHLTRLAFSPDGTILVVAGYSWLAIVGEDVDPISVPFEGGVQAIAVSPDGGHFATASMDRTARIWTMRGQEAARVTHEDWVTQVTFSPDGKYLATGSKDHTVRLWLWRPEDLIAEVGSRLSRNLTWEEWQSYLGDEPYRKTYAHLPVHPSFLEAGRELARAGNVDGAAAIFRRALQLEPDLGINPVTEARRLGGVPN
jgi:WD40 repeat protein